MSFDLNKIFADIKLVLGGLSIAAKTLQDEQHSQANTVTQAHSQLIDIANQVSKYTDVANKVVDDVQTVATSTQDAIGNTQNATVVVIKAAPAVMDVVNTVEQAVKKG